jgi:hypothetical protein
MQGRAVGSVAERLYDDFDIPIQGHEEAEKPFDGKLAEFAAQHLLHVGLASAK